MLISHLASLLLFGVVPLVIAAPTKKYLDANTYLAIDKVLNAFSFAVDERPVPFFNEIFAPNAWMDLRLPGSPNIGINSINTALVDLLPNFKTQHTFGTKSIELNNDGTVSCKTMFIGTFWGLGNKSHDWLQNYPMYYDTLAKIDGEWRITNKTLVYMVSAL
jgi:hypothetical protein